MRVYGVLIFALFRRLAHNAALGAHRIACTWLAHVRLPGRGSGLRDASDQLMMAARLLPVAFPGRLWCIGSSKIRCGPNMGRLDRGKYTLRAESRGVAYPAGNRARKSLIVTLGDNCRNPEFTGLEHLQQSILEMAKNRPDT